MTAKLVSFFQKKISGNDTCGAPHHTLGSWKGKEGEWRTAGNLKGIVRKGRVRERRGSYAGEENGLQWRSQGGGGSRGSCPLGGLDSEKCYC